MLNGQIFFSNDATLLDLQKANYTEPFISHISHCKLSKLAMLSNIGLRKVLNRPQLLFSF